MQALVRPPGGLPRDHNWSRDEVETVPSGAAPNDRCHAHRQRLGRQPAVDDDGAITAYGAITGCRHSVPLKGFTLRPGRASGTVLVASDQSGYAAVRRFATAAAEALGIGWVRVVTDDSEYARRVEVEPL